MLVSGRVSSHDLFPLSLLADATTRILPVPSRNPDDLGPLVEVGSAGHSGESKTACVVFKKGADLLFIWAMKKTLVG